MNFFVFSLFAQKMWNSVLIFISRWIGPVACVLSVFIWLEINILAAILGWIFGYEQIWNGVVFVTGIVLALVSFEYLLIWYLEHSV